MGLSRDVGFPNSVLQVNILDPGGLWEHVHIYSEIISHHLVDYHANFAPQ